MLVFCGLEGGSNFLYLSVSGQEYHGANLQETD